MLQRSGGGGDCFKGARTPLVTGRLPSATMQAGKVNQKSVDGPAFNILAWFMIECNVLAIKTVIQVYTDTTMSKFGFHLLKIVLTHTQTRAHTHICICTYTYINICHLTLYLCAIFNHDLPQSKSSFNLHSPLSMITVWVACLKIWVIFLFQGKITLPPGSQPTLLLTFVCVGVHTCLFVFISLTLPLDSGVQFIKMIIFVNHSILFWKWISFFFFSKFTRLFICSYLSDFLSTSTVSAMNKASHLDCNWKN